MPDIYVRSSDGLDTDNGSTWALAKATAAGAAAIDVAGDRIFFASTHNEVATAAITVALAGTGPAPTLLASVSDAAQPPTAVVPGATIRTTGTFGITISGAAGFYAAGLTLIAGQTSTGTVTIALNPNTAGLGVIDGCSLQMASTGGSSRINLPGNGSTLRLENTTVRFAATGQGVGVPTGGMLIWNGGGVESGGSAITTLFPGLGGVVQASGLNLTACATNLTIFGGAAARARGLIRNSRLPAGWTGALASNIQVGDRYELHNCDSGDTNYRLLTEEYAGSVRSETTIVRTGGATDGAVPFSWRMASNANAEWPALLVNTPELAVWNATEGSPITVSVEIVTDGVTLNDDEIWLDVQHLGTAGFPQATFAGDSKAHVLATAAAQASSSAPWSTPGLATPVRQQLSVTITPQSPGWLQAVVHLARPSTTVFVDPVLTIT